MENKIELRPVELDEKYRKRWNVSKSLNDFVQLYINGKKVNNSIYRVGGFGVNLNEKYFMLLKQVESNYSKSVMTETKKFAKSQGYEPNRSSRYLANCSCIIDNNGVEKKVFENTIGYPYLCGGCVYVINNDYHNIETDELYCSSSSGSFRTKDSIFINNEFDRDKSKRGVLKINKNDGSYELFES